MGTLEDVLIKVTKILGILERSHPFVQKDEPAEPPEVVDLHEKEMLRIFEARQKWVEEQGAPICTRLVRFPGGDIRERRPGETIPSNAIAGVRVFPRNSNVQDHSCHHNHFFLRCDRNSYDRTNPRLCTEYLRIHEGVE